MQFIKKQKHLNSENNNKNYFYSSFYYSEHWLLLFNI